MVVTALLQTNANADMDMWGNIVKMVSFFTKISNVSIVIICDPEKPLG